MFCTTGCCDCEDKSCDKYISKTSLYFDNKKMKNVLLKIEEFLDNHDKCAGKLYYKYDNKYLISEIKEDIRNIIREARND